MNDPVSYGRQAKRYINDFNRCAGALVGIAQGLVCDQQLSDREVHFLSDYARVICS